MPRAVTYRILRATAALLTGLALVLGDISAATAGEGSEASPPAADEGAGHPARVVVRYRDGAAGTARTALRRAVGLADRSPLPLPGTEVLTLPEGADVEAALEALGGQPGVVYAEPDHLVATTGTPNDPLFSDQWSLSRTNGIGMNSGIDAPRAWNVTTGTAGVSVAIVDSGVGMSHPDLAPNAWTNPGETGGGRESNGVDDDGNGLVDDWRGWDWADDDGDPWSDPLGHGTHVAGTAAARGGNGLGVAGVSWKARVMALRVINGSGVGYSSDVAAAFVYAARHGARVVNASLSGSGFSNAMHDAIAASPGALFVVAAGNEAKNNDTSPSYPCSYDLANIVCVAATDQFDDLASFSNRGASSVDLGAPGSRILNTWPGDRYLEMFGTSMATPHVAGAAALAWSLRPDASPAEVKAALLGGGDRLKSLVGQTVSGNRLSASGTLTALGASADEDSGNEDPDDDESPASDSPLLAPADRAWTGPNPSFRWDAVQPGSAPVQAYRLVIDGVAQEAELQASAGEARPTAPLSPGTHTWTVAAVDAEGGETPLDEPRIVRVDDDDPRRVRIKGPRRKVRTRQVFRVRWRGHDPTSGIRTYEVRYRQGPSPRDLGGLRRWRPSIHRKSAQFRGRVGLAYCFTVRAMDRAGNRSDWSPLRCTVLR